MDTTTALSAKISEDFWFNKLADFQTQAKVYSFNEAGVKASIHMDEEAFALWSKISQGKAHSQLTIGLMAFQQLLKNYLYYQSTIINVATYHQGLQEGGQLFFDSVDYTDKTVREVLSSLGTSVQETLDHQDYRQEQLNERLAANGIDQQLFEHFNLIFSWGEVALGAEKVSKRGTTLLIESTEDACRLTFNSQHQVFSAIDPEVLLKGFSGLLRQLLSNPAKALSDLPYVTNPQEVDQLLMLGKGPVVETTHNHIFDFAAQITNPNQIAISHCGHEISYQEFEASVNMLAAHLKDTGISKGSPVGVYMENSVWSAIACFAIMKAGAVYLPLDPSDPFERTLFKARDAQTSLVIIHSNYLSNFISSGLMPFAIDIQLDTLKAPEAPIEIDIQPSDIAYIMYTSGSTGEPKGARITHGDLLNLVMGLVNDCAYSGEGEVQRVALVASIGFDPSIQQIMSTLLQNMTLVVVSDAVKANGNKLVSFLNKERIDRTDMTPSHLRLMVEALNETPETWPLKQIWIGGEALPSQLIGQFNALCDQPVEVVNLYGLTETSVDVTAHRTEEESANTIAIGRPLTNRKVVLLDAQGQLTPYGGIGELAVALQSKEVYLKRELNQTHILEHPVEVGQSLFATGDLCYWKAEKLYFLERRDEQVKLNGVRIEPSEIETVLKKHKEVVEAIVLKNHEQELLAAYVVSENGLTKDQLDEHVKDYLPRYMRPAQIHFIKEIPLTANGKIDKAELAGLSEKGTSSDRIVLAPATQAEEKVLGIWANILDQPKEGISTDDNFFVLGGNSLKAAKVVYELYKQHEIDADIEDLFTHPTIGQLAKNISQASELSSIAPVPKQDHYPTTSAQNRIWLECKLDDTEVAYNMPYAIEVNGKLDTDLFFAAINLLVARNEILRTYFSEQDGLPRQFVKSTHNVVSDFTDLSSDPSQEAILQSKITSDFQREFNLEEGPLFHFAIYKTKDHRFVISFVMHHIIGDGWSIQLLLKKIFEAYDQLNEGSIDYAAMPALQYKDYTVWLESHLVNMEEKEKFWQETLKDLTELNLFSDQAKDNEESFAGSSKRVPVEADLVRQVKQYATEFGLSDNLIIMSAYIILLHKYSLQTDFVIGYPVSGRIHPDSHDLIGCFVNMLPVRVQFEPNDSFSQLLQKTEKNLKAALAYQEVPYEEVLQSVNKTREAPLKSLFDVVFLGQNEFDNQGIQSELDIANYPVLGIKVAHFKLMLSMFASTESIEVDLNYREQMFDAATVNQMLNQLVEILNQAMQDPEVLVKNIQLSHALISSSKESDVDLTQFEF